MTSLRLGTDSYKRSYADSPEIVLENRFLEKDPSNEVEGAMLLARPGSNPLKAWASGAARGSWSMPGMFNGDLLFVAGTTLYRFDGTTLTTISGTVANNGFVHFAPQWGSSGPITTFNNLFIADGQNLQYYNGGSHATGTLTYSGGGTGDITTQVIQIGALYYTWGTNMNTGADGSSGNPFVALVDPSGVDANSLQNMANLLMFTGTPGVDFSATIGGPSTVVTAAAATALIGLTALSQTTAGNSIATVVTSGADLSFGHATLQNGGVQSLLGVPMPNGVAPKALAAINGYVLVSVANSQLFYYINPGEQIIDPLNFNAKQSWSDNILDMVTVGDQVVIMGGFSTENWYATGNALDAFAPYEGRVFMRGTIEGTAVLVKDSLMLVGNDGIVYAIGYQYGTGGQFGVQRISTHGIEERIRVYIRQSKGLTP